jgi:AP-1-like factor
MSSFYYPSKGPTEFALQMEADMPLSPDSQLQVDKGGERTLDWNDCDKMMSQTESYYLMDVKPTSTSPDSETSSSTKSDADLTRQTPSVLEDPAEVEMKRKAQNRAAQRAFRERKEQRVRELEQKLSGAETELAKLRSENERLRKENTILMTENQVLHSSQRTAVLAANNQTPPAPQQAMFPNHRLYANLVAGHSEQQPSYLVYEKEKETMLGAGAVWQMLIEDPVMSAEDMDINFVVEYLKDKAQCDGFGPVFPLREVNQGIRLAKIQKSLHSSFHGVTPNNSHGFTG